MRLGWVWVVSLVALTLRCAAPPRCAAARAPAQAQAQAPAPALAPACAGACAQALASTAASDAACAAAVPASLAPPAAALVYDVRTREGLGAKLVDWRHAQWAARLVGAAACPPGAADLAGSAQHDGGAYERAARLLGLDAALGDPAEVEACEALAANNITLRNVTEEQVMSYVWHAAALPPPGLRAAWPPARRERWRVHGGGVESLRCLRRELWERRTRAKAAASRAEDSNKSGGEGGGECVGEGDRRPRLFARADPGGSFAHVAMHVRRGDATHERLAWRRISDAAHAAVASAAADVLRGDRGRGVCVHVFTDAKGSSPTELASPNGQMPSTLAALLANATAACGGLRVWGISEADPADVVEHLAEADVAIGSTSSLWWAVLPAARGAAVSIVGDYWAGGDTALLRRMLPGAAHVGAVVTVPQCCGAAHDAAAHAAAADGDGELMAALRCASCMADQRLLAV